MVQTLSLSISAIIIGVGSLGFISSIIRLPSGQILGDIDMYNRVREMFNIFSVSKSRTHAFGEGFINTWEYKAASTSITDAHVKGINPSQSVTVRFKPLSAIRNQQKYLPIRFMRITTIELSWVDDP